MVGLDPEVGVFFVVGGVGVAVDEVGAVEVGEAGEEGGEGGFGEGLVEG